MTQRIVPSIWCNDNAEAIGEFYASVFPNTTSTLDMRYPDDVPAWHLGRAGTSLVVRVVIDGFTIILINGGPEVAPNPSISLMLNFDPTAFNGDPDAALAALEQTWNALAADGTVQVELGEYQFSKRYGWVRDRFGVSWQLILTNPQSELRPFVIPQLLFCGAAQGRAREAAEFYVSLFDDAKVGFIAPYPEDTGAAKAGDVMFGEFQIAGRWLSMMDSTVAQPFTFDPGMSIQVRCDDQAEIDHLWDAMTADPTAEQVGWLTDKFGVHWQIIPDNLKDLAANPESYRRLLGMKKIVIADL